MYAAGISIRPLRSRHRAWLPGAWRLALLALLVVLASLGLARVAMGGTAPAQSTVVVRPGDTLWSIAVAHYPNDDPRERVDAIEQVNGLSGPGIEVGESLQLPPP